MSPSQAQLFEDELPLIRCCPTLNEIRLAEEIKDLTIEVKDGATLHAHRVIMAARIPFLRPTLSGSGGKENSLLRWPSVPLGLATSLVNYVYTGQMEITQANAKGLIMFAKMMKLPVLENWGVKFMANNVNLETLRLVWDFARPLNIAELVEACIHQMKVHFESFVYSDLFVHLPAETVLTLLRGENLLIDSEERVFGAISRWMSPDKEVDVEKMKVHAPAMLKEVQWHRTTAQFRKRLLDDHPIFQHSPECARLMAVVEQWIGLADVDKPPCPLSQNSRLVKPPQTFFVFGKDKNQNRWSVLRFDSDLQNEERIADMELRYGATFSVVGKSIFVVGGQTTQQVGSARVDEFLVKRKCWRKRSPLVVRRRDHAAVVVKVDAGDKEGGEETLLGVFGGSLKEGDTWLNLPCCELYDVSKDRWYQLPNLRERRCGPAAASLPGDNRVFVFGGRDDSSVSASVEFCQLRVDWQEQVTSEGPVEFWQLAAPMGTARAFLTAAPFRAKIIVAGGWNCKENISVVEMFSPPDAVCPLGQWSTLTAMEEPRASFSILTSGDTVFVLGGDTEPRNTISTFTASKGALDFNNEFVSWVWSSKCTIGTLKEITGAAAVHI
ncbi:BTB And C-terminal Kelch [Sparganum proliferum]